MTTWSYKVERFDLMAHGGYGNVQTMLNTRGAEGWELIGVQQIGPYPYVIYKKATD